MFDSVHFSVAVMTQAGFDTVGSRSIEYNYAWLYNTEPADDIEAAERSDKFLDVVKDELTDYDEDIVKVQVDALTEKLEKAGEEYGEIFRKNFEDKVNEVTDSVEKGAKEYAEIYQKSIEEKMNGGFPERPDRRGGIRAASDDHRGKAGQVRALRGGRRLHLLPYREHGEHDDFRRRFGNAVPAGDPGALP